MRMLRGILAGSRGRLVRVALVVIGLALALTFSACGDDDGDGFCSYEFADVLDSATCEALADEFDCTGYGLVNTDCTIEGCVICQDVDTDYDGDFDFDGDIDDDD
jgi:hypothetical protein